MTSDLGKGYALRSELTWTHYRLIIRVENENPREWYIAEAVEQRWSSRQLERNIYSMATKQPRYHPEMA
jgi:hypothetical protein